MRDGRCIETKPIEIEVDVVVTMSLRTKIKVDDYDVNMEYDDDERKMIPVPNFEDCNLNRQVERQITIPTDTEQFKDWTLDDFFVQTV